MGNRADEWRMVWVEFRFDRDLHALAKPTLGATWRYSGDSLRDDRPIAIVTKFVPGSGGRPMLELIIVILLVLWLIGFFGPARFPSIPNLGGLVHLILLIVLVLVVVRLLT